MNTVLRIPLNASPEQAQRLQALLAEFGLNDLLTSRFALPAETVLTVTADPHEVLIKQP